MLNFGLDKNTNANSGQLHYQLGLGGAWLNSDIEGTVMIRPVMRADLTDSWVGFVEVPTSQDLRVFPNPVKNGMLQVEVDDACLWRLFDSFGRQLLSGNWQAPGIYSLDITRLAPGTYLLTTAEGECTRFIVE